MTITINGIEIQFDDDIEITVEENKVIVKSKWYTKTMYTYPTYIPYQPIFPLFPTTAPQWPPPSYPVITW